MPSTSCPRCRHVVTFDFEQSGGNILCPSCGTEFNSITGEIGSQAERYYPPPVREEPIEDEPFLPDRRRSVALPAVLALGLIVAAVLIIGIIYAAKAPKQVVRAPKDRPVQVTPEPDRPARFETPESEPATVAGVVLGSFFCFMLLAFPIAFVVTDVLILAWVAKDARSRGMDGGPWVLVILASNVIGLLVYLASRPHGVLVVCGRCGNKRMQMARRCPSCGQRS